MKKIVLVVSIYVFLIVAIFLAFNSEDVFAGSGTDKYTVELVYSGDRGVYYTFDLYKFVDSINGQVCYITYASQDTEMVCIPK